MNKFIVLDKIDSVDLFSGCFSETTIKQSVRIEAIQCFYEVEDSSGDRAVKILLKKGNGMPDFYAKNSILQITEMINKI